MRRLLILCTWSALLLACSSATPEEQAAQAAKEYYDLLLEDNTVDFMAGKAGIESMPGEYCEELLAATKRYVSDINRRHNGLREVRISPNVGRLDSLPGKSSQPTEVFTHAFLLLCYSDSTQEEITVPMVKRDGQWLMR